MKLSTLRYSASKGWEAPFPALDSPQTLVIVFGSPKFLGEPDRVRELTRAYPASHIIGCSTAGEILGTEITDDSLVVAITRFDTTTLASIVVPIREAGDSFQVGVDIARKLADPQLKGVMVLSEGVIINGTQWIGGLNSVLPPSVVVTGGLAGDGPRFERTWTLTGDGPRPGLISAVGMYGDAVHIGHGSRGGWDIFGVERTVTRAKGNVLYELDGKPALALYKD